MPPRRRLPSACSTNEDQQPTRYQSEIVDVGPPTRMFPDSFTQLRCIERPAGSATHGDTP